MSESKQMLGGHCAALSVVNQNAWNTPVKAFTGTTDDRHPVLLEFPQRLDSPRMTSGYQDAVNAFHSKQPQLVNLTLSRPVGDSDNQTVIVGAGCLADSLQKLVEKLEQGLLKGHLPSALILRVYVVIHPQYFHSLGFDRMNFLGWRFDTRPIIIQII